MFGVTVYIVVGIVVITISIVVIVVITTIQWWEKYLWKPLNNTKPKHVTHKIQIFDMFK